MLGGKDPSNNPGPRSRARLDLDKAQEGFHRIGADFHSNRNFLACQSLQQIPDGFPLATGQAIQLSQF